MVKRVKWPTLAGWWLAHQGKHNSTFKTSLFPLRSLINSLFLQYTYLLYIFQNTFFSNSHQHFLHAFMSSTEDKSVVASGITMLSTEKGIWWGLEPFKFYPVAKWLDTFDSPFVEGARTDENSGRHRCFFFASLFSPSDFLPDHDQKNGCQSRVRGFNRVIQQGRSIDGI